MILPKLAKKALIHRPESVEVSAGVEKQGIGRSEEHTSELQSQSNLVCRLLLEKKKCSSDFCNRLVATMRIAAHHYDVDAKRGQFISCRSANPAGSACNKCRQ